MTIRWYLTNTAAPGSYPVPPFFASGAAAANWEFTSSAVRRLASLTKAGNNAAVAAAESSATSAYDVCTGQWIFPPFVRAGHLFGQTILAICNQESSTSADFVTKYVLYVINADGSNIRAASAPTATGEWPTTPTVQTLTVPTMAQLPVEPGQHLVIETGYRAQNVLTTTFTGTNRYGGTAGDVVSADTANVTTRSPWVEFADDDLSVLWTPHTDAPPGRRLVAA